MINRGAGPRRISCRKTQGAYGRAGEIIGGSIFNDRLSEMLLSRSDNVLYVFRHNRRLSSESADPPEDLMRAGLWALLVEKLR